MDNQKNNGCFNASLISLLIVISMFSQSVVAQVNSDSLFSVWFDEEQKDTIRFNAVNALIQESHSNNNSDSLFYFADLCYEFAKAKNNKVWMAYSFKTKGVSFTIKNNFNKALEYYDRSLKTYQSIPENDSIAIVLSIMGVNHYKLGNYSSAIKYCYRSLKVNEEVDNKKGKARVLNTIGVIHFDHGNHDKALEFYKESLKIKEEIGDKEGVANSLNNIGTIYVDQEEYDKASFYFEKSMKIKLEINDYNGISNTLTNIGHIYFGQEEYTKALDYYNKSLVIDKKYQNKLGIASSLINIGNIYMNKNKNRVAIRYYHKALSICQEIGAKFETGEAAKALYLCYETTNNYSESLKMHILYINIRDSILNEENQKAIIRQEYKYEYEKLAIADSIKSVEEKKVILAQVLVKQYQLKQEKILRYVLVGGIIILIVLTSLIIRGLVIRKRKEFKIYQINRLLEKEKLTIARNELEHKKQQLNSFIDSRSKNNSRIQSLEQKIQEQTLQIDTRKNHLQDLVEMKILTNEDWTEFKSLFMKAYPNFEFQIKQEFPDVSNSELRMFMLLKLKRSSQDISNMLGISVNSVKTNRYRLRKKLNLDTKENLQSFIDSF
jgi:tetratricopeptide (TPR) repeat protein/DNA-binding CsgD family transcriptional regulator